MPPHVLPHRRPRRRPGSKGGPPENPKRSKMRDQPRANINITYPTTRRNSWSDITAPALKATDGSNNWHESAIDDASDGESCTGETMTFPRVELRVGSSPHGPSARSGLSILLAPDRRIPTTQKQTSTVGESHHKPRRNDQDRGTPWALFESSRRKVDDRTDGPVHTTDTYVRNNMHLMSQS